jgi:hypothetical protein
VEINYVGLSVWEIMPSFTGRSNTYVLVLASPPVMEEESKSKPKPDARYALQNQIKIKTK